MAYKTPGVYVQEIALFPPSVAEVATAVPAFIGYTDFSETPEGKSLALTPTRIQSLLDYETYFGYAYAQKTYTITVDGAANQLKEILPDKRFHLYSSLRQYFDNGGGPCYIVSVGTYADTIGFTALSSGIESLKAYDEPTLILFPDAVELKDPDDLPDLTNFSQLQNQALAVCALMQDRFSIFDVLQGDKRQDASVKPIDDFRDATGLNNLNYGAAYYPWITTSYRIDISFRQLSFQTAADPPVSITDYTPFSKSDTEKNYLTDLQDSITDGNSVLSAVFSAAADQEALRKEGTALITEKLLDLQTTIGLNASAAEVKTAFGAYMDLLAAMATSFKKVETALGADSPLANDIAKLRADKKLTDALAALVSVEKNTKVIANSPTARNAAAITALYTPLEPDWLGGQTYAAIAAATEPAAAADKFTANSAGALNIIRFLKDTINTISTTFNTLFSAASFFEKQASQRLFSNHPFFKGVFDGITLKMQTIPPSGAVAGVYARIDGTRGVWKAPANVSLNNVIGPAVKIDNSEQDDLNVTPTGKSINAIRAFAGKGTLIWGARTLAGNDNEWRYVPVRRFFIMVEESVKKATEPFVFEPNDANTWVKVRVMIQNFLTLQWRAGALQGAKPEDAFFVHVGLNETMTAIDILEGRMIVEIGMAVVRPAEFIILRFTHKMQDK